MPRPQVIFDEVAELQRLALLGDSAAVMRKLRGLVPTFAPGEGTLAFTA